MLRVVEGGKGKQDKSMCTTKNYRRDTTKIPKDFIEFIPRRQCVFMYATTVFQTKYETHDILDNFFS